MKRFILAASVTVVALLLPLRAAAQPVIDQHQALMWKVGDLMHQWEMLQTADDLTASH